VTLFLTFRQAINQQELVLSRRAGVVPDGPPSGGPYSTSTRIGRILAVAGRCGYLPDRSLVNG
jgi:2-iminobutanoate/2-iminopropanoate deaminase